MWILTCISLASISAAADGPTESPKPPVAEKAVQEKPAEKETKKAEPKKKQAPDTPPTIEREEKTIEGWRVRVDKRLLTGPAGELGRRAERLLRDKLYEISELAPQQQLERLRRVNIVVDLDHGRLTSMQYHPSAEWLRTNGYAVDLEKCFHIPSAERFVGLRHQRTQPWCVLHELAHAYHDQVLGFDDKEIRAAYEAAKAGGTYDDVLHIHGHKTKHYALTTPMEYFAELSEAYFGTNDFYPFVRGELMQHDPRAHAILEKTWGKLP
ncbi:MAG: metallopeptidase [Pirellula sp.]|nr:metallopeptidase [Pirellula sp.]